MAQNNKEKIENLISKYINSQLNYVEFTQYMERKIKNLMIENNLHFQTITYRVKDVESLRKKLACMGKNLFDEIGDDVTKINDLSGIRIIVYNRDEQRNIENLIYENFNVEYYSPERENYDAKNITISLKSDKMNKFSNMKCEIQIVLILSHALIEFGHDIFYKDQEELKKKDKEGYEELQKIYEKSFEKIIQIETEMNEIKVRNENIKHGRNILNTIIDKKYIEIIKNANTCSQIGKIIENLNSAITMLSKERNSQIIISKNKVILELVKAFIEMPDINYESTNFYFNTYEYTLENLLDIIKKYIYLCTDDLKQILNLLIKHSDRYLESKEKIIKAIKDLIKADKNYYRFSLSDVFYEWILENVGERNELKSEIAIEYCDLYIERVEYSAYKELKISNGIVRPNEKYRNDIINILNTFFKEYLRTGNLKVFKNITLMIQPAYGYNKKNDLFKMNEFVDFFNQHYNEIDTYIAHSIYETGIRFNKDEFIKLDFYKKVKKDKTVELYAYLFSYTLDDIPIKKYDIREKERNQYLDLFIEKLTSKEEKQIIDICKIIDKYETELYYNHNATKFLYKVGLNYKNALKLYEKTDNKVILFGLYNSNKEFIYNIKDDNDILKILKYLDLNKDILPIRLFDQIVEKTSERNCEIDKYICQIILKNLNILKQSKYLEYVLSIVRYYNNKKINIITFCNYGSGETREFIKILKKTKLKLILKNISYKIKDFDDEILIEDLFEVYPDLVREYIKGYLKNNFKNDYRFDDFPIEECVNFKEELDNNIEFVFNLLDEYEYYKISKEIRFLVGKYNEVLFENLKNKVKKTENIKKIIDILKILDVSINAWNIFELIIEQTQDEDIYNDIDCLLFSSTGSGEYGLANTFESKYLFFKDLEKNEVNKNINAKKFVKEQKEKFRNLYQSERAKTQRRIISEKEKYNILNKKDLVKKEEEDKE